MKREDAMRLLGGLGEVQGRVDRLCDGLRDLLADGERRTLTVRTPRAQWSPPIHDLEQAAYSLSAVRCQQLVNIPSVCREP
jgi:hypothetical protein